MRLNLNLKRKSDYGSYLLHTIGDTFVVIDGGMQARAEKDAKTLQRVMILAAVCILVAKAAIILTLRLS